MSRLSKERAAAEEAAAQNYAERILGGERQDWVAVNQDLRERWSMTALHRVKARAWEIVDDRRRSS